MDANARPQPKVALVADDRSPGAGLALARAALLLRARGGILRLIRVLPAGEAARHGLDAARLALERRGRRALGPARRRGAGGTTLSATVVAGKPFVEIVRHARLLEADLVVLGAHGRRRWRDALAGTTAERVVRKGDVPVLIVKRPPLRPYRRVVAAVEASDAATRVVELAAALLGAGARLTVLSCFTVPFEAEISGGVPRVVARTRREYLEERRAACAPLVSAARGARAAAPRLVVVHGDPRTEVLRFIVRTGADLLVLGTHGRSGLAHALLGSTAEALLRGAPCDVAVTRPARFTFEMP